MKRSDLIEKLANHRKINLSVKDVEEATVAIINKLTETLIDNKRIEIRGFGSFSLHYRRPRLARNPKTGDPVSVAGKYVPYFRAGKEMRERVNKNHQ